MSAPSVRLPPPSEKARLKPPTTMATKVKDLAIVPVNACSSFWAVDTQGGCWANSVVAVRLITIRNAQYRVIFIFR
jgi:hypothetical protein